VKVDVRVIAASNQDLKTLVHEGKFREDLYYRLNVLAITVPPLRERPEDVASLARHFLAQFSRRYRKRFRGIAADAMQALLAHDWPGNVRELEHAMERVAVMHNDDELRREHLPGDLLGENGRRGKKASPQTTLEEMERELIVSTLKRLGGRRNDAARALGIDASTLWRKIRRYGLQDASSLQNA
jgi:two-component system response regulator HydG